ncbi:MAG: DUF4215 domain-containing protein [Deltaproteobacteria bacterium]|nr:DUF4215 domain-containing protein [Deltaproteobacteria bacterium]
MPSASSFAFATLALLVVACAPSVPEGRYACDPAAGLFCPDGMFCRTDGRCWRSPDDGGGEGGEGEDDVLEDGDLDGETETTDDGTDGEAGCEPAACDDGRVCNGAEGCTIDGVCGPGRPPDEGTACTTEVGVAGHCFIERCRPDTCGDCHVDEGEDCDDCNAVGGDGCEPDCLFTCELSAECQDPEICNGSEVCDTHDCVPGTPAIDGIPCGAEQVCIGGVCGGGACGDGIPQLARGEECDDGNDLDGDGCDGDCTWSCGIDTDCDDLFLCDGVETCDTTGHVCEPGAPAADGTPCLDVAGADGLCRAGLCAGPDCGNAATDAGEQCDDGNLVPADGCEADCTWSCEADPDCADTRVCNGAETCTLPAHTCAAGTAPSPGTSCDRDANPDTRDVCIAGLCSASVCGDRFADAVLGESCDDGNFIPADGCENDCTWSCEAPADCDDGDACNGAETCGATSHACGAGTPQPDGTPCTTAGGVSGACRSRICTRTGCGNGVVDTGEECDDGNLVPGDGCESDCLFSCHLAADCGEVPDNPCTSDTCSANANGQHCVHAPNTLPCNDGDPCTSPDRCDGEGACAGALIDADGDTYGPGAACGGDCNDGDDAIHPGAAELCNAADDDCNGTKDDGSGMTCVRASTRSCTASGPSGPCVGTETCSDVCTWSGACIVGASEVCNGADDDCDGVLDEGFPCILGSSSACVTTCAVSGSRSCGPGCALTPCAGTEVPCNGCDDDADGVVDEGSWCPVAVSATADLYAVGGSAPDDVWIVGDAGTILHWDGAAWTSTTSGTRALRGVWAAGASDAWAVGDAATIFSWDGSGWSAESAGGAVANLFGVWGSSTDDIWAVGRGGAVLHRTAGAWATVPSGSTRDLRGVWGSSASDVFAVGFHGVARRWEGSTWAASATGSNDDLYAVTGSGASDAWAVGLDGTVLRWNGTRWTASSSGSTALLRGVWAATAGAAWTVGGSGVILVWDGSVWAPDPGGGSSAVNAVWGNSSDVWIAGAAGTVLRRRR